MNKFNKGAYVRVDDTFIKERTYKVVDFEEKKHLFRKNTYLYDLIEVGTPSRIKSEIKEEDLTEVTLNNEELIQYLRQRYPYSAPRYIGDIVHSNDRSHVPFVITGYRAVDNGPLLYVLDTGRTLSIDNVNPYSKEMFNKLPEVYYRVTVETPGYLGFYYTTNSGVKDRVIEASGLMSMITLEGMKKTPTSNEESVLKIEVRNVIDINVEEIKVDKEALLDKAEKLKGKEQETNLVDNDTHLVREKA